MVRFDAYTATTTAANPYQLVDLFGDVIKETVEGRGFHQFGRRLSLKDGDGHEAGSVSWGGAHGERSMIEVKGERTPLVVERLRSLFPHRVTRMDSCADFDAPGAFERLLGSCMTVKRRHRLRGKRDGDWEDFPELGRTLYLGSEKSPIRFRLYEAGRLVERLHLNKPEWVRGELQIRPQKDAKAEYSNVSAEEAWGASAWTRELAGEILMAHVDPHPAGTVWKRSKLDSKLHFLCKQYGATLLELKSLVGSWDCVGLSLSETIKEMGIKPKHREDE